MKPTSLTYRDLEEIMAGRNLSVDHVTIWRWVQQDHRLIKKRITASLGFRSVEGACRTIEGYEAMHAIRKGQVRWVAKSDPMAQRQFIHTTFGIAV
jgi:transposase-like protein